MSQLPSAQRVLNADISRIIKYAPTKLIGREAETRLFKSAWAKVTRSTRNRQHVLVLVALGGEGKTSLVADWAVDMQLRHWPGCDAVFAWSFYSQGTREQTAVSSDAFLAEALKFFGDEPMAGSAAGAFDKGRRLAQLVGERRSLLILDGLEPLQYAPTSPTPGELKDAGIAALLKGLAATNHGLCVVTTRYAIPDLRAFIGKTVQEEKLPRLSTEAGVALLQFFGVKGSLRKTIPSADGIELLNEFERLVEDVKGHALTLNLLGSYLRDAHGGDIRRRDLIKMEEADSEEQGSHAFHVMDAYVVSFETGGKTPQDNTKGRRALALLRLLGLFDRPATADCLKALWNGEAIDGLSEPLIGITEAQRNMSRKRLEVAKLLTVNRDKGSGDIVALDAHPLLREYFARQLRTEQPDAWRAAHRRLYEHLCETTKEGEQPTLEDLQPLYQAVAHGCQAGLHGEARKEVYRDRIQRGQEAYSTKKLGALGSDLGAIACFFEQPWSRVSSGLMLFEQGWLLNEAAYTLRALGRLTESLEPMRAAMKLAAEHGHWKNAATGASNLSELEVTLGELDGAVGDAEQSVTYADSSGDAFQRMGKRTTHADALHQAGRRAEAETRLLEAEKMQAEDQPDYPLLCSLQGFRYCDLLLAASERAAWQIMQRSEVRDQKAELSDECRAVGSRAELTLKWAQAGNLSLLTIALDRLTLGRAALYEDILTGGGLPFKTQNLELKTSLDDAVHGLRRAGEQIWLTAGLLTRAWLRFVNGERTGPESAQEDLDEAWEIAERGPMRLHMADIHLYRARLFGGMKDEGGRMKYPWDQNPDGTARGPKDDLAAARKLIEHCGYWRRKEELEDAEEAAKNW